jgi:dethiobiotin synthetase
MAHPRFIVTGTDTGVGKTVFSAALTAALDGCYWKPIQAGLPETDSAVVQRLSGLPRDRILPEAYRLRRPASPHIAAGAERIEIDTLKLRPPTLDRVLVVEGAGGLAVPINARALQIDVFANWFMPIILCARTSLGTINHSLLSLEALRRRAISIHGIAFIGEENPETERTIVEIGGVRRLGRLPWLDPLDAAGLQAAFAKAFRREDFA